MYICCNSKYSICCVIIYICITVPFGHFSIFTPMPASRGLRRYLFVVISVMYTSKVYVLGSTNTGNSRVLRYFNEVEGVQHRYSSI